VSFCTLHAFYDCPVCKGEALRWEIPVMNAVTGEVTGEIVLTEGEVEVTGDLPHPRKAVIMEAERLPVEILSMRVDPPEAEVETLGPTEAEVAPAPKPDLIWFAYEIDLEAARERGREVFRRAEVIAEEKGIPLSDALKEAGGE
jgi:hypothetical protein